MTFDDCSDICSSIKQPERFPKIPSVGRKLSNRTIKPFKQGHLDGLCGIYAIINGFRLVLGRRFNQSKCEHLFNFLTQFAIKELGLLDLVSEGIGLRQMQQLLTQSSEYLDDCICGQFEPGIIIKQPWRTKSSRVGVQYTKELNEFLTNQRTAVIIGIDHPIDHWTVLRRDNIGHVGFFDSGSLSGRANNKLIISTRKIKKERANTGSPQAVFFLV